MPEPARRRTPLTALRIVAVLLLVAAAVPAGVTGYAGGASSGVADVARVVALAPPPETCAPTETRAAGDFSNICGGGPGGPGGGGINLGGLVPIIAIVAVAGVIALLAAFVLLRRTSAPLVPADPGEWWTCKTCGKTNVLGSARCYACGTWQR